MYLFTGFVWVVAHINLVDIAGIEDLFKPDEPRRSRSTIALESALPLCVKGKNAKSVQSFGDGKHVFHFFILVCAIP